MADRDRRHHDQPAARRHHAKPGSAQVPLPGIAADVVDDEATSVPDGRDGRLPRAHRALAGDAARHLGRPGALQGDLLVAASAPKYYFAGDGAKNDDDGDIWLLGRVDDVMNVSGHRLSTAEIESALVSHPRSPRPPSSAPPTRPPARPCARSSSCAATPRATTGDATVQELRNHVAKEIGPIAKPRQIIIVPELPKTRSGKIMRRLLRTSPRTARSATPTTLADTSVMDLITEGMSASRRPPDPGREKEGCRAPPGTPRSPPG